MDDREESDGAREKMREREREKERSQREGTGEEGKRGSEEAQEE